MRAVDEAFLPVSGLEVPRFAGVATMMRLPLRSIADPGAAEIGVIGVPWDGGTTNRPGARHGPRAVRDASTMVRTVNAATAAAPFHTARFADLGDVAVDPNDLARTVERITRAVAELHVAGVAPLTVGGDHLTSLPVLRALAADGPLGMVHLDAHTDLFRGYFGGQGLTHGTPFRVAVEEGLLDPARVIQIGIRGTSYDGHDREFARAHGIRVVTIEELRDRGAAPVMEEARARVGDGPTYLSFDIDVIDPSQAPGTGTPEVGGVDVLTAQGMVRALEGLDLVGADLVEVSPPFDLGGLTAWAGASMLFEIACVLATATARRLGREPVGCAAFAAP